MKPVIFGLKGASLTRFEKEFFARTQPAGFILFARNIDTPAQVSALTSSLRELVSHTPLLMVDQEGGRVQRLGSPHWKPLPPVGFYGSLEAGSADISELIYWHSAVIASQLKSCGFNTACYPVLDVPIKGSDPIISDRAFARDPLQVATLARIAASCLIEQGVLPVIKHIPGHGRALVDSHLSLPLVDESLETLSETDFLPFEALSDMPLAMTAHIAYSALDGDNPASFSSVIVRDIIRERIGFEGIIMSDDLAMKALDGDMGVRALKTLAAGVDLVLHCNGDPVEMEEIANVCSRAPLSLCGKLSEKTDMIDTEDMPDIEGVYERLQSAIKAGKT